MEKGKRVKMSEKKRELIGAGRSADVYAVGSDRVLRRFRTRGDAQAVADVMIYLEHAGYPVPKVYDASGGDLVMERLDGRDMLADLGRPAMASTRHACVHWPACTTGCTRSRRPPDCARASIAAA